MFWQYFKRTSTDNTKKAGLYQYVFDFAVDYQNIGVKDILDIDKYLMRNTI